MQRRVMTWRLVCWMSMCLLAVACTPAPTQSPVPSPTASGPSQAGPITVYHGHTSTIFAVVWSPDGTRIASAGNDSTVQIWNATTGHRLVTYHGHAASVRLIAWSPESTRIASASQDGTVQVWEAATGKHLVTYHEHKSPVWAVAWSPDGTRLVSASGNTSYEKPMETVQVWNAVTGHTLIRFSVGTSSGQTDGIFAVSWSPTGTRIAAGGADTTVYVWNVPPGA